MMIHKDKHPFKMVIIMLLISLSVLLIVGVLLYRNINELNKTQRLIAHTYEVQILIEKYKQNLLQAESRQRGYLITKDSSFYERYLQSKEIVNKLYFDLLIKVGDNPEQLRIVRELDTLTKERFLMMETRVRQVKRLTTHFPDTFIQSFMVSRDKMVIIKSKIDSLLSKEDLLLTQRTKEHDNKSSLLPFISLLVIIFSLILILGSFYIIYRNIIKLNELSEYLLLNNESFEHAEEIARLTHWEMELPGNKITFSKSANKVLGYAYNEANNNVLDIEKYLNLVHPDDQQLVRNYIRNLESNTNATRNIVFRILNDKDSVTYLRSSYMLYEDDRERTVVLGINQDISEKILYQKGLETKNEELMKYNKELSSFNYVVSHDLQEPLRKIRMFVSRIKDDGSNHLSEKSIGFFDKVQDSALRMQNLIDDLLAYSRINRSDLKKEQIDLNSIIEQVIQDWAHVFEDRKVIMKFDRLPIVNGYIFQLHQLFSNIIGNSLKYSKSNISPQITITHSIANGNEISFPIQKRLLQYHEIKISDNGIGFDTKYAEEIFDLFKRLHNKESYKGTGIGLAICRKIVEQHNGYIFAQGKTDIGATFFIYLPHDSSSSHT